MSDTEFMAAQHQFIVSSPCRCTCGWMKNVQVVVEQCRRCRLVAEYQSRMEGEKAA